MQRNNYLFGVFMGTIIPLFGIVLVYVIRYIPKDVSFTYFLELLRDNSRAVSSTLSLGLIACIPLFTYYRNRKLYKTLYGIFIPVIIYGIIILLYRFNLI